MIIQKVLGSLQVLKHNFYDFCTVVGRFDVIKQISFRFKSTYLSNFFSHEANLMLRS